MNIKVLISAGTLGLLAAIASGCSKTENSDSDQQVSSETMERRVAIAELSATEGNEVTGTVTFVEEADGIRVIADITGLTPGLHGFHVHENGDCSAPDASSAGGHFNPEGADHAGPSDDKRHVGDLGNIEASDQGSAMLEVQDEHLSFDGAASIIGKSVIVHAGQDDLKSQPSGAAGARVACGIIKLDGE